MVLYATLRLRLFPHLRWGINIFFIQGGSDVLNGLEHEGLPRQIAAFENDAMTVRVRQYIEGVPPESVRGGQQPLPAGDCPAVRAAV